MSSNQDKHKSSKIALIKSQKKFLESLRLRLYRRPLHPELFEIGDKLRISSESFEADIWITPASHVVSFYRGESTLSEVLAPDQLMLPTRGLLHNQRIGRERVIEHNTTCGLKYLSSFHIEKTSSRVMRAAYRDFARRNKPTGRFLEYHNSDLRISPGFTYFVYEILPKGLHFMTFHALGSISAMIKTQSLFEIVK